MTKGELEPPKPPRTPLPIIYLLVNRLIKIPVNYFEAHVNDYHIEDVDIPNRHHNKKVLAEICVEAHVLLLL